MLYLDTIWCAAARVIGLLQKEAESMGIVSLTDKKQPVI